MINGIIKLFYSEVVKSKISKLPHKDYFVRNECKEINSLALKIDTFLGFVFKILAFGFLFYLTYNFNKFLLFLILTFISCNFIYQKTFKQKVKTYANDIKTVVSNKSKCILDEKIKSGINILCIILVVAFFTDFNWVLFLCFMVVFLFTTKHICSNMK